MIFPSRLLKISLKNQLLPNNSPINDRENLSIIFVRRYFTINDKRTVNLLTDNNQALVAGLKPTTFRNEFFYLLKENLYQLSYTSKTIPTILRVGYIYGTRRSYSYSIFRKMT